MTGDGRYKVLPMPQKGSTFLVGMSGGVDSSFTALYLLNKGYKVIGATMCTWNGEKSVYKDSYRDNPLVLRGSCYGPDEEIDLQICRDFCSKYGIPYYTVDVSEEYKNSVLEYFTSEYLRGRTPNPCIWCNEKIKFGAMLDYASSFLSFDYFATGHYARIEKHGERYCVAKAKDLKKDQSYFLSRLSQKQLSSVLFPLGDYLKSEIREIDESLGFHEKGQSESQDFYGGDYSELLNAEDRTGDIVFEDGRVLGHHKGYWHYTMGQRKGLGVAYSEPLYVIDIDPERNRVVVGTEESTHSTVIHCGNAVYGASEDFDPGKVYQVKVRSMAPGLDATAEKTADGFDVRLKTFAKGAAPGQSAVVYDGDAVIASGVIEFATR